MIIEDIQCMPVSVPLKEPFETSFGRTFRRDLLLIRVFSNRGIGEGECPVLGPEYSSETVHSALDIVENYVAKALKGQSVKDVSEYRRRVASIRGNNMAKAGVEFALWDVFAQEAEQPLYRLLGGKRRKIPCGMSIGVQQSLPKLLEEVQQSIELGYQRIKLKIHRGWDISPVEAVRLHYPDLPLMVDANGGYRYSDLPVFRDLDRFDLMMIEQPLEHDDFVLHAKLQSELKTPVCLDESIESFNHALAALELGSCRIINLKPPRVGGLAQTLQITNLCLERAIPLWCGGMLETGLAVMFNLAAASLHGFCLPNDIMPSRTYLVDDVIQPEVAMDRDGFITLPDVPGIGCRIDDGKAEQYSLR